jgi:hypothetical protein
MLRLFLLFLVVGMAIGCIGPSQEVKSHISDISAGRLKISCFEDSTFLSQLSFSIEVEAKYAKLVKIWEDNHNSASLFQNEDAKRVIVPVKAKFYNIKYSWISKAIRDKFVNSNTDYIYARNGQVVAYAKDSLVKCCSENGNFDRSVMKSISVKCNEDFGPELARAINNYDFSEAVLQIDEIVKEAENELKRIYKIE